jgi:hypothetical protein
VHWFDRATGTIAGRTKTGGDRVTNPPLAVNDTLYLITTRANRRRCAPAGRARARASAAAARSGAGPAIDSPERRPVRYRTRAAEPVAGS